MLKRFRADLHIHTCLSPCGSLEMLPTRIVEKAKLEGLDLIGICDHNSSENVAAVKKIGERENLKVLGGMEVTSKEEVHILALFDEDEDLLELKRIVYENLHGVNDEQLFGEQLVADEQDEILNVNTKLLIGATELSIDKIVEIAHSLRGLVIASHVDRERFGIIGQLGFIPDELALDALEVSPIFNSGKAELNFSQAPGFPLVTFSDAHFLEDIGKGSTTFLIKEPKVYEIKKALLDKDGRKILMKN